MQHEHAPILDALVDYRARQRYGFTPPGHRQGRGADDRVIAVLGLDPFRADVLANRGLDDRRSRGGYLACAEELMADAVGRVSAEQITPYPPGIPAVVPGERLDTAVIEYLRTGIEAGMNVPDPADPSLKEFRVVV